MLETLTQSLEQSLGQVSLGTYLLVFLGGALTGFNPCTYPTIPVIIGLIGRQEKPSPWRSLALSGLFVLGLALTYMILGAFFSFVGRKLGLSSTFWYYLVAAVCIGVGLGLAGVFKLQWQAMAPLQDRWMELGGFLGAFLLGLLFGLVATPCATPILAVIVAFAAAEGTVAYGASLLFVYAIGHGLPLLLIGTFAGAMTTLSKYAPYAPTVQKISGWILVLLGLYFLWKA